MFVDSFAVEKDFPELLVDHRPIDGDTVARAPEAAGGWGFLWNGGWGFYWGRASKNPLMLMIRKVAVTMISVIRRGVLGSIRTTSWFRNMSMRAFRNRAVNPIPKHWASRGLSIMGVSCCF